jgi:DNA mismatch repair protein MutS2
MVKVIHAKPPFIEPEETIELNNDVNSLETDERKEVIKVLRELTSNVAVYSSLLQQYHDIVGDFDFIRAKGKLAIDMRGNFPNVVDKAHIELRDAYHPVIISL